MLGIDECLHNVVITPAKLFFHWVISMLTFVLCLVMIHIINHSTYIKRYIMRNTRSLSVMIATITLSVGWYFNFFWHLKIIIKFVGQGRRFSWLISLRLYPMWKLVTFFICLNRNIFLEAAIYLVIFFDFNISFWSIFCKLLNFSGFGSFNEYKVLLSSFLQLFSFPILIFSRKFVLNAINLIFLFWVLFSHSPVYLAYYFCNRRIRNYRLLGFFISFLIVALRSSSELVGPLKDFVTDF
ncbi:hypothetical protein KFK09_004767 [Dendrobium nobile]|uniref:Uncharacterized protein n=1 Tax=Dendrobium nobile TaxID=94219 RepID=A0A8T3BX99_DENNO|nr:hypothetical protein KFK09_004767 [Dendrobium nobile]